MQDNIQRFPSSLVRPRRPNFRYRKPKSYFNAIRWKTRDACTTVQTICGQNKCPISVFVRALSIRNNKNIYISSGFVVTTSSILYIYYPTCLNYISLVKHSSALINKTLMSRRRSRCCTSRHAEMFSFRIKIRFAFYLFTFSLFFFSVYKNMAIYSDLFPVFSDISKRNTDYSETLDFRRGWGGGHVYRFGNPWLRIRNVNTVLYIYEPLAARLWRT